tara:strand:+ start:1011 stop:2336 length:1326 start_codon:yes stop_codon:yes gene_type:complete
MGLLDDTTQQSYYEGNNFGTYQFTSLNDIINQFMIAYVGEDKLISKVRRTEVAFHAQRALSELSFDTFKSCKSQEIEIPDSGVMKLPHDYVNYVKLTWKDTAGVEHIIYPASKTSNPFPIKQNTNGSYFTNLITNGTFAGNSDDWTLSGTGSGANVTGWTYSSNKIVGFEVSDTNLLTQTITAFTLGKNYTIRYTISNYSAGSLTPVISDSSGNSVSFDPASNNGVYEQTLRLHSDTSGFINNNTNTNLFYFQSSNTNDDFTGTIDNVSIIEQASTDLDLSTQLIDQDGTELSDTWGSYSSHTPNDRINRYDDGTYDLIDGERYGMNPQYAQINGSYYIDCDKGLIYFGSNISGKTVTLKYISDSLGTDEEMKVHKFAEDAMYKWIMYSILSTRSNIQEFVVARYRREKIAATRKAKIRLSNIKLEEITQILRGKSKWIKH